MPTGSDPVAAGKMPSIRDGGPGYRFDAEPTQRKNRSLGYPRVKTRPAEKGV